MTVDDKLIFHPILINKISSDRYNLGVSYFVFPPNKLSMAETCFGGKIQLQSNFYHKINKRIMPWKKITFFTRNDKNKNIFRFYKSEKLIGII